MAQYFKVVSYNPTVMKSNFQFYFQMLIVIAVLSCLAYALCGRLIEQHAGIATFVLLVLNLTAISGMLRNMAPAKRSAKHQMSN